MTAPDGTACARCGASKDRHAMPRLTGACGQFIPDLLTDNAVAALAAQHAETGATMDEGVTQTFMAGERLGIEGNCLQAAVATLLGLPLDAVPHFAQFTWWDAAMEFWARGRSLTVHRERTDVIPERPCIVYGRSDRGFGHAVIGGGGRVVWDPHPDRTGLVSVQEAVWFEDWPTFGEQSPCFACGRTCDCVQPTALHRHDCPCATTSPHPDTERARTAEAEVERLRDRNDAAWQHYDEEVALNAEVLGERDAARAEATATREAVAQVRALHGEVRHLGESRVCGFDFSTYPCATIRALDSTPSGEATTA